MNIQEIIADFIDKHKEQGVSADEIETSLFIAIISSFYQTIENLSETLTPEKKDEILSIVENVKSYEELHSRFDKINSAFDTPINTKNEKLQEIFTNHLQSFLSKI